MARSIVGGGELPADHRQRLAHRRDDLLRLERRLTAGANGDAGNYGGVTVIIGGATTTLDTDNSVTIASNVVIDARDAVTIRANSFNTGSATGDAGSGALIAVVRADATLNQTDRTSVSIGASARLNAGTDLTVEARNRQKATSKVTANAGGLGVDTRTSATLNFGGATTTEIGGSAELRAGNRLDILADVTSLDLLADAKSTSSALGAGSYADATINKATGFTTSLADIKLRGGAVLAGANQVNIKAHHDSISSLAKADATTHGLGASTNTNATNNFGVDTRVLTEAGSIIRTRALAVDAVATPSVSGFTNASSHGALIDTGDQNTNETIYYPRTINFNSDVFLAGPPSPELVIDENGRIIKQVGFDQFIPDPVGPVLVLPDIINRSTAAGTATFTISPTRFDPMPAGYGTAPAENSIQGNSNITFLTSFDRVTITNRSKIHLEIGLINPVAATPNFAQNLVVNVTERSRFKPIVTSDAGHTIVTIDNSSATPTHVTLTDAINNGHGAVSISTAAGDIINATGGRIEATALFLSAAAGSIGSGTRPILTQSARLDALAAGNIWISETGDLGLGYVRSTGGTVNLVATGYILDADSNVAINVKASTINLRAGTGSIGEVGQPSGTVVAKTETHTTGPTTTNIYTNRTTPTIVGVAGGADAFGILSGLSASDIDFDQQAAGKQTAVAGSLLAVMRFDHGVTGTGFDLDYTGYDMLVIVNTSTINLSLPSLKIDSNLAQLLHTRGVGADQALTVLKPGEVWAVLIPEAARSVTVSIGASASGMATTLSGALADGNTGYVLATRPALNTPVFTGFDAIAADADVSHIYGVSSQTNALVAINAADGSQRQIITEGAGTGASYGLTGVSSVVVGGGFVVTASASTGMLSIFSVNASGDLSHVGTRSDAPGHFSNLRFDAAGNGAGVVGTITATGPSGVKVYSLHSNGTLSLNAAIASSATEAVQQGGYSYVVDSTTNSLRVVDATSNVVQTLSGNLDGLFGASDIAVSPDGGFLYVTSQSGDTLSVYRITSAAQPLVLVQTLHNGSEGVRGLSGPTDVAVTPDGKYVMAVGGSGNTLAVFSRDAATGKLIFAQVVRDNVGGIQGLNVPTAMAFGPSYDGNGVMTKLTVYVGSFGTVADRGGLASFDIDLDLPPPAMFVTEYSGVEAVALLTAGGDDTVNMISAPPSVLKSFTIDTGAGNDHVVVANYVNATTVNLGAGDDTFELRVTVAKTTADSIVINAGDGNDGIDIDNTGTRGKTTINGDAGDDRITIGRVGSAATTIVSGGTGNDTVRIAIANLPANSVTTLHGDDPTSMPGDLLILDPQNPQATVEYRSDASGTFAVGTPSPNAGQVRLFSSTATAYGTVTYDTFEGVRMLSSPTVRFNASSYTMSEGGDLVLTVTVSANGSTGKLSGPVKFDIDGDGQFGEVEGVETRAGSGVYRVTIPWTRLKDFGLGDNLGVSGVYTVAVRVINEDGLSTTAFATVRVNDTPPVVAIIGNHTTNVGDVFTIDFSAIDPSPKDVPLSWRVDWGDGNVETFGATTTRASHVYTKPGIATIYLYELDKDTSPNGTPSSAFVVTIGMLAPQVVATRPREGEDLTLTATAVGTPSSFTWVLNGHTLSATDASVTLTWAQLQALGLGDGFMSFTVVDVPPVLVVQGATAGQEGSTYVLDLNAIEVGNDVLKTWEVDWGDNTVSRFTIDPASPDGNGPCCRLA